VRKTIAPPRFCGAGQKQSKNEIGSGAKNSFGVWPASPSFSEARAKGNFLRLPAFGVALAAVQKIFGYYNFKNM